LALVLDAGPLFASLDPTEPRYLASRRLIESAQESLIIPAPVLVEVDWLISERLQNDLFTPLLEDIRRGRYSVETISPEDMVRIFELLTQYADAKIGFVDAAVLTVVERLREPKVATLDRRHFTFVRLRHVDALALLPE
jgi:predicted nucleic acid-binding protein